MNTSPSWLTATTSVREQINLQQPTQAELAELALVLLEEVWVAFKEGDDPAPGLVGDVWVGAYDGSAMVSFKRVLEAAHDLRLRTAPTFAPV